MGLGGFGEIHAEPPGRAEGGPAGKAARAFETASQATPQRPEAGSSVAPRLTSLGAPCVRALGTTIAPRRRAVFRQTLLVRVAGLSFSYPDASAPSLSDVSLRIEVGEVVAVLGPSGSGKSTLLRALAGLVPHFHGGRFEGRVEIDGRDTRRTHPAELAGRVASLFQDPEDQVVFGRVANEVAFGLENVGTPPERIWPRVHAALSEAGIGHLVERRTETLSAGELQRVCLASVLALEPALLLLDEPTSQLDPAGAKTLLDLAVELESAVVVSEQRPAMPLERCDRVLFLESGRILLDAPREDALKWLAANRPGYLPAEAASLTEREADGEELCRLEDVTYAYLDEPVLRGVSLTIRRGEVVALTGPNGIGKTTLAKIAAGLLTPEHGTVERRGRAGYLSQDPGRYLVADRAEDEVALGVGGNLDLARGTLGAVGLSGFERRHPRDLSSGERERLALASVLATDPEILILDEPTRGVDPPRKAELAELIRREAPYRATLVVTHDLVFASEVADRGVVLSTREPAHV
ncbi:MAG: ATP-binding cassette domain-containing protein [Actinomycetota bacterium]